MRTKLYTAKSGVQQYKPSIQLLEELSSDSMGFCLACGETADEVEPDAIMYTCECCGANKVYGAEELALMCLYFSNKGMI